MSQQMQKPFVKKEVPMRELLGGVQKPLLGFGTWLYPENKVYEMTKKAIRDYGYRQIDTAKMYKNEE
jgi:diketogulonate reductase-like aldo/keto reductase